MARIIVRYNAALEYRINIVVDLGFGNRSMRMDFYGATLSKRGPISVRFLLVPSVVK